MPNLKSWLQQGEILLAELETLSAEDENRIAELLQKLRAKSTFTPRLYLLANEGVHPIVADLQKQYGADIRYEVVARGNVSLDQEAAIARRVKKIVEADHNFKSVRKR